MHTQYPIADVGMLQMNKAEVKRYVEGNITIIFMIISSSPYIYIYLLQVLHSSRVFLLLNALCTNKARFFRARSFCVAKSKTSRNSHGLLKYLVSVNSYLNHQMQDSIEQNGLHYPQLTGTMDNSSPPHYKI